MKSKPKEKRTALIKVLPSMRNKVAKVVAGTPETIGQFYDKAAEEKLSTQNKK